MSLYILHGNCLPLSKLRLAQLIDHQDEHEFLGARGVGLRDGFRVIATVRGTLKPKHHVSTGHHRHMLVIIKGAIKPSREQIGQDQVIPEDNMGLHKG